MPVTVLGNGSNLLVADTGIRGIVIRLRGNFRAIAFRDPTQPNGLVDALDGEMGIAVIGAGMMNTVLLNKLNKLGLGGLGCLAGVPGTIGGAIRMNAGTRLGKSATRSLLFAPCCRTEKQYTSPQMHQFAYRKATLPAGAVVTRIGAWVSKAAHEAERTEIGAPHLPQKHPAFGHTVLWLHFKNPPGDTAGRLIDAAGLKGHSEEERQISEKHANFFINTGNATATDLYKLIKHARDTVSDQLGSSRTRSSCSG